MSKTSTNETHRIKAQRILNAIKPKHDDDTAGAYFMTETLNMKTINFLQACDILNDLETTQYKDAGAFESHKGMHPTLGELILVVNAVDGSAMLIQ